MIEVRPLGPDATRSLREERRNYRAVLESAAGRVRPVLDAIRREGDAAVARWGKEQDGWSGPVRVSREAWDRADLRTPGPVRQALQLSAGKIRSFHTGQHAVSVERTLPGGSKLSLQFRPLGRVGVYAPGGRYPSPSTVLMTALPAKVAGVAEVVLATPPRQEEKEGLSPVVATAARLAGVERIYLLGGAVAVGALAFGTPTIPRVDKLVGPGNRYFTAAKREVMGEVGIDALAGPSESLIVADRSAPLAFVVAEAMAQVEHGSDARARVVALGSGLAELLARRLEGSLRSPSAAQQLEVWAARDLSEVRRFVEAIAPEVLFVAVEDLGPWERDPPPCGALFLGPWSSVAFGDYVSGTNQVLPVEGTARFQSGLTTYEFGRWLSTQRLTQSDALALAPSGVELAEAEGMSAHAEAMRARTRPLPADREAELLRENAAASTGASRAPPPRRRRGR